MRRSDNAPRRNMESIIMSYQVAIDRGQMDSRLSSQWCSRPADERFESLAALHAATETWRRNSEEHHINTDSFEILSKNSRYK